MEMVKHNINCHCVKFDHQHSLCNKKMFTTNYYAPSLIQKKYKNYYVLSLIAPGSFTRGLVRAHLICPAPSPCWRLAQKLELANRENDHHVENLRREANPCKTFQKCSSCYKNRLLECPHVNFGGDGGAGTELRQPQV